MPRRTVIIDETPVLLSMDDPPPLGERVWGLVRARLTDEMTGQPPTGLVRLESDLRLAAPRVASDGLVGLVGVPRQVFPALAAQGYRVMLRVEADGYVPQEVQFQVLQEPGFPATFTPPPLAEVGLHREPTVIYGRIVRANGTATTPLAGATVRLLGIWRTPPSANLVVAADPPDLVSLAPSLYAARTAAAGPQQGHVQAVTLSPAAGSDKEMLDDVLAGDTEVRLSNRVNLSTGPANNIVQIDADNPDRMEYLRVTTIAGASNPDLPARVTLAHPLAYGHRRQVRVRVCTETVLAVDKTVAVDVLAGDATVFLDNLVGVAGGEVRVMGGLPAVEYHRLALYNATSDAEGYYRLPPLGRVAQVRLRAESGALAPVEVELRPAYELRENRLDFMFR